MKPRKTRSLPAQLEAVRRRFERWRRSHRPRARIPDSLWAVAVRTAGRHGIHCTARTLRLDYYSLQERITQQAADADTTERKAAGAFLELPPPAAGGPCECTVEWEDGAGAKMRLWLKGVTTPDLAALSRDFWNRRS